MLISLGWVNEFVELPQIDADDLANSFTMTTAEVEDVQQTNQHLNVIKVAQIKSLRKHPEADKLNLVTFDFGGSETKEVVCGAPNVKEGLKVPYAPLGTTLPGGFTLEPKKIRGILSDGMLCSEVELGLGEGASGLMELPEDAPIGQTMGDFLKMDSDIILDVDNKSLTHRPDLWGHYGIAREFAAAYEKDLKKPFDKAWKQRLETQFTNEKSPIDINVDSDSSCLAFWGISMNGVKVGPSPAWMQNRLTAAGMRPINNIVDISNYVMLELGMPLHIYDRKTIEGGTVHIKRAQEGSEFTTLDEMNRKLLATDTVICDADKPLVLAGVMGGLNSGVTDDTDHIFIEVANWKAEEVRKTSTRLGLRTDSSSRYEKSLDSLQCYRTLLRTIELVQELCPGATIVGKAEYDGTDLSQIVPLKIQTSRAKINAVLGHDVSEEKLLSIFNHLDFEVEKKGEDLALTIPTYRTTKDIENEADIIEEVGRMIGYDNIADVSPMTDIKTTNLSVEKQFYRKVQDFMMLHSQSYEIMTYPLVGPKLLDKANWDNKNEDLILVNALSKDADRMRPSLIPSLLNAASLNTKRYDKFSFFEFGRSYLPEEKNFATERYQLAITFYDKNKTPFLELLNTVEKLLNHLKVPFDFAQDHPKFPNLVCSREWIGTHPHEFANIRIMGKFNGAVLSVHPLTLKSFKINGNLAMAVIDFTDAQSRPAKDKTKYTPIHKFPSSTFDCTVLVDSETPAANVLEALKKVKLKELVDKRIADIFILEDGKRAVTVRTVFEDANKTLDAEFIKSAEDKVVSTLANAGFPLKV
jgi:phenylalanyl-tRNA synthetase beta chain